jgi:cell division protein ZapA (FtsZ GTPase activity inhibitor)
VALALTDPCSGKRTLINLASDVDTKVKEFQDTFNKLRLALQDQAVILTAITVLHVLDAVGDLCEFSE